MKDLGVKEQRGRYNFVHIYQHTKSKRVRKKYRKQLEKWWEMVRVAELTFGEWEW